MQYRYLCKVCTDQIISGDDIKWTNEMIKEWNEKKRNEEKNLECRDSELRLE